MVKLYNHFLNEQKKTTTTEQGERNVHMNHSDELSSSTVQLLKYLFLLVSLAQMKPHLHLRGSNFVMKSQTYIWSTSKILFKHGFHTTEVAESQHDFKS